jgi:hypothetical protein
MRAAASTLPPAANGTITVTGRVGQFCAWAGDAMAKPQIAARHASTGVLIVFMCCPSLGRLSFLIDRQT